MDGYSVQDAASVLGVPEGRVWELLARGVLSGTPEGDSMRVFLRADAPAPARPPLREELPRSNGNGGSHGAEASAFRELLTEFRNLTERYGQALLALGEARGEVAGLRSRVELLEARIDLRGPSRMDLEPVSWAAPSLREPIMEAQAPELPAPAAAAPEPPAPAEVEAVLPSPSPVDRSPRPRKPRSTREAVAGFAEALARAQDPNLAPVGEMAAAELLTEDMITEDEITEDDITEEEMAIGPAFEAEAEPLPVREDELEPVEVAASAQPVEAEAEPLPVREDELEPVEVAASAQPVEATYLPAEVEPDWFADGDFSWLDAADLEARSQPPTVAVEVMATPPAEPLVEIEVAAAAEPLAELMPSTVSDLAAEPGPEAVTSVEPEAGPEERAPVPEIQAVEVGNASEEPVMWLGGEREPAEEMPAEEMEVAPRSYPGPTLSARIRDAFEPVPWPATDRGAVAVETMAPPLAMTEEELMQLARDEGWDDAEVSAIRAMITRPPNAPVELPGSAELDEAISALQAVPITPRSEANPANQWAKPATRRTESIGRDDWAFEVEPPLPQLAAAPSPPSRRDAAAPAWLRRRRGPAADAYRRIRRIFTG